MARARNIKYAFFQNELLPEIDPLGRLMFIGLWTLADREGRLEEIPKRIKGSLFAYEDCDVERYLKELEALGFIIRYEVKSIRYVQIINFTKHQSPHRTEKDSVIPAPDQLAEKQADNATTHHKAPCVHKDQIEKIFQYWKDIMAHPQAKLDEKRRQSIRSALKSGYSIEELCQAISGCSKTPHNMGQNENGQRYDGLHVILRDADQIDRFIRNHQSPPQTKTAQDKLSNNNVTVLNQWANEKLAEG